MAVFANKNRRSMSQDEARQRDKEYLIFCGGLLKTLWVGIVALAGAGGFFLNAAASGDDGSRTTTIAIISFLISAKLVVAIIGVMLVLWCAASFWDGYMQDIKSTIFGYPLLAIVFLILTGAYIYEYVYPDVDILLNLISQFK